MLNAEALHNSSYIILDLDTHFCNFHLLAIHLFAKATFETVFYEVDKVNWWTCAQLGARTNHGVDQEIYHNKEFPPPKKRCLPTCLWVVMALCSTHVSWSWHQWNHFQWWTMGYILVCDFFYHIDTTFQQTFLLIHRWCYEQFHHRYPDWTHYRCLFDWYLNSLLSRVHEDTLQWLDPYNLMSLYPIIKKCIHCS